jgi:hypothetical protein
VSIHGGDRSAEAGERTAIEKQRSGRGACNIITALKGDRDTDFLVAENARHPPPVEVEVEVIL